MEEITHLVWATMSAVIDAPSVRHWARVPNKNFNASSDQTACWLTDIFVCLQMDCFLVNQLGLKSSTKRLAVQQMGCMGGFRLARSLLKACGS